MVGNRSIRYKDWCDEGVRFVNDLLTDKGHCYEYRDFCNLYRLISNLLNYYGIVKPFQPLIYDMIFKSPKGCKVFYQCILKFIQKSYTCSIQCSPNK